MTGLPGIEGSLFPGRFLRDLPRILGRPPVADEADESLRRLSAWWRRVEATCGPATGVRALFDEVAMPLVSLLGFRARDAVFERTRMSARLVTGRGSPVGLIVLPWATRPSRLWRDLAGAAREIGADWCLLIAPPFVSLVDARGHALRRNVDFRLPDALHGHSLPIFSALSRAGLFDAGTREGRAGVTPIDLLVAKAETYQQTVRRDLQAGVVRALTALGPALLAGARHERSRIARAGDPFGEALTLVYRMLFLLFAESRELVPRRHPAYGPAYALTSIARDASTDPSGLWDGLAAITRLSRSGCETGDLIVRPFNGRLFARASAPSLESCARARTSGRHSRARDTAVAAALEALATRPGVRGREQIAYADLGVEQLGAVYESVLDLDPSEILGRIGATRPRSAAIGARPRRHSRRRKETGTFYTPQSLCDYVVRRTLAPLVRDATTDAILRLRVVDPAMGSGAFLVAACRFLAHAYETALVREGRCADTDLDEQARAVIRRTIAVRCLAGVDANPVAVQLARLSLWLTTLARDKPLNFFDDRLRVGNSLVGTTPSDLWRVRPGSRRRPLTDTPLFDATGLDAAMAHMAVPLRQLREGNDETVADVRARERVWAGLTGDRSPLGSWRMACDLWCARWFWRRDRHGDPPAPAELRAAFDAVLRGDRTVGADRLRRWLDGARDAARAHQFFHWPLEFADIFWREAGTTADRPGFDAVVGNPPWEVLRRDSGENADADRIDDSVSPLVAFLRQSGHYPACDRGHVNLYQPFLERSLSLVRSGGRVGLVLPWGLASDAGAASLRARLVRQGAIDSVAGFDNAAGIFPIHRGVRFMVLVAIPDAPPREARARFGLREPADIDALPGDDEAGERSAFPIRISSQTLRIVGGPALRIPDARSAGDFDRLFRIASRFPALGDRASWAASFGRELNATEDRGSFGADGLPVIDGKHIGPFRVEVAATTRRITPADATRLMPAQRFLQPRLGYRDVSGVGNRFSLIAAVIPAGVVTTHTLFCLRTPMDLEHQYFLCGLFNSATLNAIVRMLMGGHVTTDLIENLPVPPWRGTSDQVRVAELSRRLTRDPADTQTMAALNSTVAAMYVAA